VAGVDPPPMIGMNSLARSRRTVSLGSSTWYWCCEGAVRYRAGRARGASLRFVASIGEVTALAKWQEMRWCRRQVWRSKRDDGPAILPVRLTLRDEIQLVDSIRGGVCPVAVFDSSSALSAPR
jgi:hypothetical protein